VRGVTLAELEAPLVERFGWAAELEHPVTGIAWAGDEAAFTLGDGSIAFCNLAGRSRRSIAHEGAILCAAADPGGRAVLTGGDDGRVLRVAPDGTAKELGRFGKWVDHLVASPLSGLIVAAVGREAMVWTGGAAPHRYAFPSSIGGLALDGKGKRLAVSHYGGVSLVFASSPSATPQLLPWGGSHLACTFRPEGDYVLTATQELGLHGWRLTDRTDLQMSGYHAKVRSFSWSRRSRWLATSGGDRALVWPFESKDGPMGKRPLMAAQREALVTRVAFQPRTDMLAVGYDDGLVLLVRVEDDAQLPVESTGDGGVSALAWNRAGTILAYGCEDGRVGLLDMTAKA